MENMLQDKVAIITGSGRGIGQAAAIQFAREGAKVVVSDIDPEPANQTVEEIKKAGGQAVAFVGDATADDFAEAGDIRRDPEEGLCSAAGDPEAGHHLVEDQQAAVLVAQLAQAFQVARHRRDAVHVARHRFDDDRRDLAAAGSLNSNAPAAPRRSSGWKRPAAISCRSSSATRRPSTATS